MLPRCQERRLRQTRLIRPEYAENFKCIGPACEDTCCQGWSIPIDQAAYEKYKNLPASPLLTVLNESVSLVPENADSARPDSFARIEMNTTDRCPLLSGDRLCRIQMGLGETFLSSACATYPRIVQSFGGIEEKALALSCPQAARLVLLNPELLADSNQPGVYARRSAANEGESPASSIFSLVRESVLSLVRNRAYPLWQRLFLLGVLCQRLDAIGKGELKRTVPAFLGDFEATVATGALRTPMETLPTDGAAQLDVVLRLAGMMLHRSNVRPRFVECVQAFTAGIGNGPGATLETLAARYALTQSRYYGPFFARNPHILENYLINTILRCQFPFGREGMQAGAQPSMTREVALLTAQFALMRGLLIGVAGFHREAFSAAHVVHTVQAASKHFEHHPEFLKQAHALLVESRMDGARGLAILLRNAEPAAARPDSPAIHAPGPVAGAVAI
jgi:lysine-N-methylase